MFITTVSTWSVIGTILQILGSLGVFLYGMKVMSEGVQKVAGDRMRAALSGMTGNRLSGIMTGLFTTTLVQSSSATTVLVVSFVNAGLLTLIQAIGVIMGAKIQYIGNTLVDIGELSLAEADGALKRMARLTSDMFDGLVDVMSHPHEDLSQRVKELKRMEDTSDEMLHDITAYLIQCSTHEIGSGNALRITAMLRAASELEEATDRIYRLVKIVERKYQKGREFGAAQDKDLAAVTMQVRALLDVACNSLAAVNAETLESAQTIEDRVDALRKRNNKSTAQRMQQGAVVQTEMIFIDMNNHLEAVANHALNVIQAGRRETVV